MERKQMEQSAGNAVIEKRVYAIKGFKLRIY